MSDAASADASAPAGPASSQPKKSVSPTRNLIGLIVLALVVVVGYFEISAKYKYTAVVNAMNERMLDDDKDLMTEHEVETILGNKPADGPGEEVTQDGRTFIKKTYTWPSPSMRYRLMAYYLKQSDPRLHHIETPNAPAEKAANGPQAGVPAAPSKAEAEKSPGGGGPNLLAPEPGARRSPPGFPKKKAAGAKKDAAPEPKAESPEAKGSSSESPKAEPPPFASEPPAAKTEPAPSGPDPEPEKK